MNLIRSVVFKELNFQIFKPRCFSADYQTALDRILLFPTMIRGEIHFNKLPIFNVFWSGTYNHVIHSKL